MSETVLMRLYSGEDVICQVKEEQDDRYFVDNVVVAVPMERGQLSFAPWSPLAKEGVTLTITKNYIVYVTELNEDLVTQYEALFSKVITPQKKLIV